MFDTKHITAGVWLLLLLLTVYVLYSTTQLVRQSYANLPVTTPFKPPIIGDKNLTAAISNIHIFDISKVSSAIGLDIKLVGIFLNSPLQNSRALITVKGKNSTSYAVGEAMPNGIRLRQILPYSVTLIADGKLVSLALPTPPLDFSAPFFSPGLFTKGAPSPTR